MKKYSKLPKLLKNKNIEIGNIFKTKLIDFLKNNVIILMVCCTKYSKIQMTIGYLFFSILLPSERAHDVYIIHYNVIYVITPYSLGGSQYKHN